MTHIEFKVGQEHENMKGVYKVLAIDRDAMSICWDELEKLFADYGDVEKVNIIEGKDFGFVEMSCRSEADRARQALNGSELQERTLRVNEARPRRSRRRGGYRRY